MNTPTRLLAPLLACLALAPVPAPAQGPTLRDALRRADSAAFRVRGAAAQRAGAEAQVLRPLGGILPTVRLEAGYLQTTDPVAAFGTALRQRRIAPPDFAPAALNFPATAADASGGAVAEVPLLNLDAWAGRAAAGAGATAARAAERWAQLATRADVVKGWFGVLLADAQVTTLRTAVAAARSHVDQARAMQQAGLVTASDALLATVRASEIEAQLLDAAAQARIARQQVGVLLGGTGEAVVVRGLLPEAAALREVARADSGARAEPREDERAAAAMADAAGSDRVRALAAQLPRVNAFARSDWHDRTTPFMGMPMWTAGVMASWSPFDGAQAIGERRAATARAEAARAMADGAAAAARLERDATAAQLAVALERMDIAERSVAQAAEAHRLVERRYQGGLASVSELLDAQAAETATALGFAKARHDLIAALAARRLATGRDPGALAALERTPDDFTGDPLMPALKTALIDRARRRASRAPATLAALVLIGGCTAPGAQEAHAGAATQAEAPSVEVPVRDSVLEVVLEAGGTAQPVARATLATRLMATVTAVLVHEGDHVVQGQKLLALDTRDLDAKHAQVAASMADADAMHAEAERQAARFRRLYADSAAPRVMLEQAETGLARAKAAAAAARAAQAEVQAVGAYATLVAPFDGVVTHRQVDPGALAAPGQPLLVVEDMRTLRVTASVTAEAARTLRAGRTIDAVVEGQTVPARVEGVVPAMAGGVYTVNALAANAGGALLAGGAATLSVPVGRAPALLVPQRAVVTDGDLASVRVRTAAGSEVRWVKLGRRVGTDVEVLAGVRAGDRVLVATGGA